MSKKFKLKFFWTIVFLYSYSVLILSIDIILMNIFYDLLPDTLATYM